MAKKATSQRKAISETTSQSAVDRDLIALQARLRELRLRHGISQVELSKKCNLESGALSRIESGSNEPTWRTLQSIANGLGIPMYALFTDQLESAFASVGVEIQLRNFIELQRKSLEAAESLLTQIVDSRKPVSSDQPNVELTPATIESKAKEKYREVRKVDLSE